MIWLSWVALLRHVVYGYSTWVAVAFKWELSWNSSSRYLSTSFITFLQQISFFLFKYLFVWLCQVFVTSCGVFSCGMRTLNCYMWDIVPWPGIEPSTLALGAQSFSQQTTREVPQLSRSLSLRPAYSNLGDKIPLFPSSLSHELADYSLKVKSALWLFLYGPGAKNYLYIFKVLLKTKQHTQKELTKKNLWQRPNVVYKT